MAVHYGSLAFGWADRSICKTRCVFYSGRAPYLPPFALVSRFAGTRSVATAKRSPPNESLAIVFADLILPATPALC